MIFNISTYNLYKYIRKSRTHVTYLGYNYTVHCIPWMCVSPPPTVSGCGARCTLFPPPPFALAAPWSDWWGTEHSLFHSRAHGSASRPSGASPGPAVHVAFWRISRVQDNLGLWNPEFIQFNVLPFKINALLEGTSMKAE